VFDGPQSPRLGSVRSRSIFAPVKTGIHGSSRCYLVEVPEGNTRAPAHGGYVRPVAGLVWRGHDTGMWLLLFI
jgi:hypothetical protein